MSDSLVSKLNQFSTLSPGEIAVLRKLGSQNLLRLRAHRDLMCEGDSVDAVHLLVDGLACRYTMLENGRRQITAILIPGDFCNARMFLLRKMDHSIGTLSDVTVARIPGDVILSITNEFPRIARCFWWSTLVDEATLREWIVSIGRRSASERLAHLLVELFLRMSAVQRTADNRCDLHLTQTVIADILGLSVVHVNRTLQQLRREGLIRLDGGILTVLDLEGLQQISMFNINYLHYERDSADNLGSAAMK